MKKAVSLFILLLILTASAACTPDFYGSGKQAASASDARAESITLSDSSATLYIGDTMRLKATVTPRDSRGVIEFSSSDEKIASVDAEGSVTGITEGAVVIYARAGILQTSCRVHVTYPPVESIAFEDNMLDAEVGDVVMLGLKLYPENSGDADIVYFSDDERIAEVSETGELSVVGVGTVDIGAYLRTDETICDVIEVTASCGEIHGMSFMQRCYNIAPESTAALTLDISPYGMSRSGIEYFSGDESIATVDRNGIVTGIKKGVTRIYAKTESDVQTECVVIVTNSAPLESLGEITEPRYSKGRDSVYISDERDGSDKARIMLAGDLMALSSQINAADNGEAYDFSSSFKYVKDIFDKSDLSLANLETLVSYSNSWATSSKSADTGVQATAAAVDTDGAAQAPASASYPKCNGPTTYLDAVRYAGVDAVVTANNHCCDAGEQGIYETLQQLDRYHIPSTGTFVSSDEQRFLLFDVNGIKVGVVSYTEIFNGKNGKVDGARRGYVLNDYSAERAAKDVAAMKEAGAEYIIAYMHWGSENKQAPTGRQRLNAQALADAGVDLIAGSHPHVLQGAEMLTAEDGRQTLCFYSLGNFVSSMGSTQNNDTVIMDISLERGADGGVKLTDAAYIACRVIGSFDGGSYVIVPVAESYNGGQSTSALESARERIVRVMGDEVYERTGYENK